MLWGPCDYLRPGAALNDIIRYAQSLHDRLFHMLDGALGPENFDETKWGDEFDFGPDPAPNPAGGPTDIIHIPLLNPLGGGPFIRPKGTAFASAYEAGGIEFFVDASDTTYGKVCVGDFNDPSLQQLISLDPDQYTAANPGGTLSTPLGKMTLAAKSGQVIETGNQIKSTLAIGTAPFDVTSTTKVTNLNADLLDGLDSTAFVSASTPEFADNLFRVKGSADATKKLAFEVDGFTAATTRTLTPQNASYTIAGINVDNDWSVHQDLDTGASMRRDLYENLATNLRRGEVAMPSDKSAIVVGMPA